MYYNKTSSRGVEVIDLNFRKQTTSLQRTKSLLPMCQLFGGSTVVSTCIEILLETDR